MITALTPPQLYTGTKFDFSLVAKLIQPVDDDTVRILGTDIRAVDFCDGQSDKDLNHPVFFIAIGLLRDFQVSIWRDRVEIEVCRKGTSQVLSTMFPSTESELRAALRDIVDSCS